MPFIGTTPTQGFVSSFPKQSFTPNGSTTVFTLTNPVATANDLEVFVGNVRQEPTTAYTAAGTTLTMSEAPDTGLNFYVINKSFAQVTTNTPDNSVSTAKLINDAVTSAKIATDAVGSDALDLTANYTFTGTTVTPNGFQLLSTYNQTGSNVNLNSDTEIHDIGATNLATYNQFLVHTYAMNVANGTAHVYFKYTGSDGGAFNLQGNLTGYNSSGASNTPFSGDGGYIRTAFRLAAPNYVNFVKQVITNPPTTTGMPTPTTEQHTITYEVNWVYSGVGSASAQGGVRGTGETTPIQKIFLNVDPGDSGGLSGDGNFRVLSFLWGVK